MPILYLSDDTRPDSLLDGKLIEPRGENAPSRNESTE
jgi:hypothetical protein